MIRIFHNTSYDFIRWWRFALVATAVVTITGIAMLFVQGVNYSIEFTGGTLKQLTFSAPVSAADIRSTLDAAQIHDAEIQQFGAANEYVIRAQDKKHVKEQDAGAETISTRIDNALKAKFGEQNVTVVQTEAIGPRVGAELRRNAIIAMLISFIIVTVYLAIRFEWRFGIASLLASLHDILITLAFLAIMHIEVSLMVVAAILTVIGYSLNDSIIIFDRVREDLRKGRKESLRETVNRAINETLPRSILTHTLVFAATLALLIFAGEVIRPLALLMAFGVVEGVFSSIYIAAPALLWIERKWPRKPKR